MPVCEGAPLCSFRHVACGGNCVGASDHAVSKKSSMRTSKGKGRDEIHQVIQDALRKMPLRYWPKRYKKYSSALGVCDKDNSNFSAVQLPDGKRRGAARSR